MGMRRSARSFGTRSTPRECRQRQDQSRLWTEKPTPDSSIGLKNREICQKQRWKLLKRRIHKVFSTGVSQCETASVLRNKGCVRTSWWQRNSSITWIRNVSYKPEGPLSEMYHRETTCKSDVNEIQRTDSDLAEMYLSFGTKKELRRCWQQYNLRFFRYTDTKLRNGSSTGL